jgi:hypothetical protein
MDISEIDAQLCRQRSGRQLRERKPFFIIGIGYPFAFLNQIPVHIADQRNRTAETDSAQAQHV